MRYIKEFGRIYFPEIKKLRDSMRLANAQQDIFRVMYNSAVFSIIFSTKSNPYELLFGAVGHNDCSFVLRLYQGYMLENLSRAMYIKLCEVLNLNYKDGGFSSNVFLQQIATHIPEAYSGIKIQPHHIAAIRRNIDEPDKIYFLSWKHHISDGCHVSPENLDKTKKLCGDKASEFCKEHDVSSCWSSNVHECVNFFEPWEASPKRQLSMGEAIDNTTTPP